MSNTKSRYLCEKNKPRPSHYLHMFKLQFNCGNYLSLNSLFQLTLLINNRLKQVGLATFFALVRLCSRVVPLHNLIPHCRINVIISTHRPTENRPFSRRVVGHYDNLIEGYAWPQSDGRTCVVPNTKLYAGHWSRIQLQQMRLHN